MPTIVHLTASARLGGPERQMLGLAAVLPPEYRVVFLLFPEKGGGRRFLGDVRRHGFEGDVLTHDTPWFRAVVREVAARLEGLGADILFCHGYKADLLGRPAARRCGIPAVAVSHGWTGENFKVRLYERLDRLALRWMDRVICVSEGQAEKVRRAGVAPERVVVIQNAIQTRRFAAPQPGGRDALRGLFPDARGPIVGAAGRLSPEKGFQVLVKAAARVARERPDVGFVVFGEGPLRDALQRDIHRAGLGGKFVLAGFRSDIDALLPHLDLFVLPSFTEGLPNVILEAFAASVPVVATAVGGNAEVIEDGVNGHLVPPGDPEVLAERVLGVLESGGGPEMARRGYERVLREFAFEDKGQRYHRLFQGLLAGARPRAAAGAPALSGK
jgi:glycosyltransferase involved in cell wall biosynthesis